MMLQPLTLLEARVWLWPALPDGEPDTAAPIWAGQDAAQRLAIVSPVTGLAVSDTDAQRPFYYDTTTGPNWRGMSPFGPAKVVTTGGGTLLGTIDDQIVEATGTGADQTYTPYAGGRGWMVRVIRTGASTNALIISPGGTNTVNGVASVGTTNQYGGFDLYHNGTEWRAIKLNHQ